MLFYVVTYLGNSKLLVEVREALSWLNIKGVNTDYKHGTRVVYFFKYLTKRTLTECCTNLKLFTCEMYNVRPILWYYCFSHLLWLSS